MKMNLPVKLGIGSVFAFLFIIVVGFVGFPKMIKSKVKQMVNLGPKTEIRDMFLELPFPLKFKVYLFNITNPMEVQNGALPAVTEIGPFCYNEWKVKVNIGDDEKSDTISYIPKDTYMKTMDPGCKSGQTEVTLPHALLIGTVNTVNRTKPGALAVVNKAIKSIFNSPTSIFLTAKADDIIFSGVDINCKVTDFAGKATCMELKESGTLLERDGRILFSFLGLKNGTLQKRIKALRGTKNYHDVGRIVEYNSTKIMSVWSTKECNKIRGTDGTIFPPMLKKEEGIVNFSPDICRSLVPFWVKKTKYDGISVNKYTASLGDMSANKEDKCYCYTPDTCLKKGLMDLYKCGGIPIYISMPHFYDSDKSYLEGIEGLNPNQEDHEISILFEQLTGSPVQVRKRLQFNMPLEANKKIELFRNLTNTVIPLFWIEEGLDLNKTYVKPLKMLYTMKTVVNIFTWLILLASLGGMATAGVLFYKNNDVVKVVENENIKTAISTVGEHVNKSEAEN